jgi:hypothetical protein
MSITPVPVWGVTNPTTASTTTSDGSARSGESVGSAAGGAGDGVVPATSSPGAVPCPAGRCGAAPNIGADDLPGTAADPTHSDSPSGKTKVSGRRTAPPGNPDKQHGKPAAKKSTGSGADEKPDTNGEANGNGQGRSGEKQADKTDKADKANGADKKTADAEPKKSP